jgi:hypothetical protein
MRKWFERCRFLEWCRLPLAPTILTMASARPVLGPFLAEVRIPTAPAHQVQPISGSPLHSRSAWSNCESSFSRAPTKPIHPLPRACRVVLHFEFSFAVPLSGLADHHRLHGEARLQDPREVGLTVAGEGFALQNRHTAVARPPGLVAIMGRGRN